VYQQLALFNKKSDIFVDTNFQNNIEFHSYKFNETDIGDITFQSGQKESIHRWYRLTPSFSPEVIRYFLSYFKIDKNAVVLDPFSGRGTTIIECQKMGISGIGCEINPLLQKTGEFSLIWKLNDIFLFDSYIESLQDSINKYKKEDIHNVLKKIDTQLPDIHDVFRWWQPDVLKDLLIARELSKNTVFKEIYNYLWLCLNQICLDCANIHRNHPTITFDDNYKRNIDVFLCIKDFLNIIKADLNSLTKEELSFSGLGKIKLHDSKDMNALLSPEEKISYIITSPPYPNRFSYIHQTRPQLYFMEILKKRKDATDIDLETIGGTWGRATSVLTKNGKLIDIPDELAKILDYIPILKEKNLLMCNYATKYFLNLHQHIYSLKTICGKNFRGAYIVGNSRLYDVEIYTETILSKIFNLHGFNVDEIMVFRKRGGRKKLYESAVCIRL